MYVVWVSQAGTEADVEKYSKRTVKVTKQHNEDCRKLLRLMGVPVVEVCTYPTS
jgi:flap endonuclease-1